MLLEGAQVDLRFKELPSSFDEKLIGDPPLFGRAFRSQCARTARLVGGRAFPKIP
jgi:hypothetical protein